MTIKIKKLKIIDIIIIIMFALTFIIPSMKTDGESFKFHSIVYYSSFLTLGILMFVIGLRKYRKQSFIFWVYILLIFFVVRAIYIKSIDNITLIFALLFIHYINENRININAKFVKKLYILSIISIIIQMFFYRKYGVISTGQFDTNYAGMQMILLFFLSTKINNRFGQWFSILCGLLFQSRTFILAMIVFLMITKIRIIKRGLLVINYKVLVILVYVVFIISSSYVLQNFYSINEISDYSAIHTTGKSTLIDGSNFLRLKSNLLVIDRLKYDRELLLGYGDSFNYIKTTGYPVAPHNSFFQMLISAGIIITIYYYGIVTHTFSKRYKNNIEILTTFLIYDMFLSGFNNVIYTSMLMIIINVNIEDEEVVNEF